MLSLVKVFDHAIAFQESYSLVFLKSHLDSEETYLSLKLQICTTFQNTFAFLFFFFSVEIHGFSEIVLLNDFVFGIFSLTIQSKDASPTAGKIKNNDHNITSYCNSQSHCSE